MRARLVLTVLLLLAAALLPTHPATAATPEIVLGCPADATPLARFAARELRRYVYLRTGTLLPVVDFAGGGFLLALVPKDSEAPADPAVLQSAAAVLSAQDYLLKTLDDPKGRRLVFIAGGSDTALLQGVYRFAEHLGARFYLHGDVLPDTQIPLELPTLDETRSPLFELRGIQPFHDFAEGPDWWTRENYLANIAQLPKMGMNFIGLHTYPLAEPTVWVGLAGGVNGDGTVNRAYPTQYLNTGQNSGWGFRARNTSDFACGAAMLYETDLYGADYLQDLMPAPKTPEENNAVFNRTGAVLHDAFTLARALGVKTCVGTETPLRIPPYILANAAPPVEAIQAVGGAFANYAGSAIADTEDDPLYQSVRYNLDAYRFNVPNGDYTVTLKFCEVAYNTPGARVFDVSIEGEKVIENLDIFVAAGKDRAHDRVFENVAVRDGVLDVDFGKVIEFPAVAAIAVEGGNVSLKVNCGGDHYKNYTADLGVAPDPALIQSVYEGMFSRIMRTHPLDYYWFWTPEDWTWSGTNETQANRTITDLMAAHAARAGIGAPFSLATCGWVLGPQFDRALLDSKLPKDFSVSCINRDLGFEPVEKAFAQIHGRGQWAIPWVEDDPAMTVPQFWARRMRRDARDALAYGCNGLMGIFWRTRVIAPTLASLAKAGWDQSWPEAPAASGTHQIRAVDAGFPINTLYTRADIQGTDAQPVYRTARTSAAAYVLEVGEGAHDVTLHFCETAHATPGKRVFDVLLQGETVLEAFDIAKVAGGANIALDKTFPGVQAVDGSVTIAFNKRADWPAIAGITVTGNGAPQKINCGGGAWEDFAADAPVRPMDPAGQDFYADWAAHEFGPEIGADAAALFAELDGRTPRPSTWIEGPGNFFADPRPWEMVEYEYGFVDRFAALRDRVRGAGALDRFDYWNNTLAFLRAAARMNCAWGAFEREMELAAAQPDGAAKKAYALEHALPARIALARAAEEAYGPLLGTASTPGELGTIANMEAQSFPKMLDAPAKTLEELLGEPLPPEAFPHTDYRGPVRLFPLAARTSRNTGEPLKLKALTLAAEPVLGVTVHWRVMGEGEWRTLALPHRARGVFEGEIPAEDLGTSDIEYHLETKCADGAALHWPATAPALPHTVVWGPL